MPTTGPRRSTSVRGREGRLDVLVNNAAVLHLATIDATAVAEFERMLRVNCLGPFLGTRACLPLLRESGNGSIVNLGSIDSVAGHAAHRRVHRVEVRAPRAHQGDRARERAVRRARQHRLPGRGQLRDAPAGRRRARLAADRSEGRGPDEVAPAVVYFASDESRLCSGTELVLDGGRSAGMNFDLPDALYDPALAGDQPTD